MGVSASQIKQDLAKRRVRKQRAGGDGETFPFCVAKITRVDAQQMLVSLYVLTGEGMSYENVSLTQPGAGARHFLGSIPEVNDLCVVGFAPAESGYTRRPYVVGWLVPGTDVGYDWAMTSPLGEKDLPMTPAMREALSGSFGRRRHKLKQMEKGDVVGSSSRGADLHLNESAELSNRRGNSILLRDQDQALVVRTLQEFHAGAGTRLYSGMVQRDGATLPTQMFEDTTNWAADKQIDEEGASLPIGELDTASGEYGVLTPDAVFDSGLGMGNTDPRDILRRGLFIDEDGHFYDDQTIPTAVYGGKPIYRVSVDANNNGMLDSGSEVFSEFRLEVSHTSDGTLPVTEQTDGIDIDRLLPNAPMSGLDGSGDTNPLNRSRNSRMVEFVLGTAVGNDPFNERDSYGKTLVPQLFDKNGNFAPGLVAAGDNTPITEHAAFLVRVRNPVDPKAPDAFISITKGGAFRSYFPGSGSKAQEEFYQTGKQSYFGQDKDGVSLLVDATGAIVLKGSGKGRPSDNVGLDLRSEGGGVNIFAGGISSLDAADPRLGLLIRSAASLRIEAGERAKIAGHEIVLEDADTIGITASTSINMNAGETASLSTKALTVSVNGKASYIFGGPKNALPTNGSSRSTTFTTTPLTGGTGGVVDEYEVVFGGRVEKFRVGRHDTLVNIGSYNVATMTPSLPLSVGAGSGVHLSAGPVGIDSTLDLNNGATLQANLGGASLIATKGSAEIRGALGVLVRSSVSVTLKAPFVNVSVNTPFAGSVLSDGCIDGLTGRTLLLSGTVGVTQFTVS